MTLGLFFAVHSTLFHPELATTSPLNQGFELSVNPFSCLDLSLPPSAKSPNVGFCLLLARMFLFPIERASGFFSPQQLFL